LANASLVAWASARRIASWDPANAAVCFARVVTSAQCTPGAWERRQPSLTWWSTRATIVWTGGPITEPNHDRDFRRIYDQTETVAVIGAHPDPSKPSHYVPKYLQEQGFDVFPVNPGYPSEEILGRTAVASVANLAVDIDVVEVFRRSDKVSEHVEQILALDPRPNAVWMQLGIRNPEAARALREAGIEVVQDACMMQTHKRLKLGET
jgi:predicted CoA-binding protein